jgi:hypothetical protein
VLAQFSISDCDYTTVLVHEIAVDISGLHSSTSSIATTTHFHWGKSL